MHPDGNIWFGEFAAGNRVVAVATRELPATPEGSRVGTADETGLTLRGLLVFHDVFEDPAEGGQALAHHRLLAELHDLGQIADHGLQAIDQLPALPAQKRDQLGKNLVEAGILADRQVGAAAGAVDHKRVVEEVTQKFASFDASAAPKPVPKPQARSVKWCLATSSHVHMRTYPKPSTASDRRLLQIRRPHGHN